MFIEILIETLINGGGETMKQYHILLSIVRTFLHWKWCWNIPCTLYMEGSWERV